MPSTRIVPILLTLLALAPVTSAQNVHARHPGHRHHRPGKAADRLGLTGAQREQAKALALKHKDEIHGLRKSLDTAREELQRVMQSTPQDADAVRAASRSVASAEENLAVARGARRADMRSVLTPEQQAQAQAHQQQRTQKRADREQRRAQHKAERQSKRDAAGKPRKA
jgi:Spy/CpxP family protein refolding chaperone